MIYEPAGRTISNTATTTTIIELKEEERVGWIFGVRKYRAETRD